MKVPSCSQDSDKSAGVTRHLAHTRGFLLCLQYNSNCCFALHMLSMGFRLQAPALKRHACQCSLQQMKLSAGWQDQDRPGKAISICGHSGHAMWP